MIYKEVFNKMNDERFRVRFEQEDGRGEIVNEKGVELTAREVVDLLNEQQSIINNLIKQKTLMEYQLKVQDRIINEYERQE